MNELPPDVVPEEVMCAVHVQHEDAKQTRFIRHPLMGQWPPPKSVHCWHDTHAFKSTPVPLVERYYEKKNQYAVYGVFCSFSCALAYMIDHNDPMLTHKAMLLNQLAAQVYDYYEPINRAPPCTVLTRYGGWQSITDFRKGNQKITITIRALPFVAAYMLFEENNDGTTETADSKPVSHNKRAKSTIPIPREPSHVPNRKWSVRGIKAGKKGKQPADTAAIHLGPVVMHNVSLENVHMDVAPDESATQSNSTAALPPLYEQFQQRMTLETNSATQATSSVETTPTQNPLAKFFK